MPALFTRMSTLPYVFFVFANSSAVSLSFDTSAPIATALPPASMISETTLSAPSLLV